MNEPVKVPNKDHDPAKDGQNMAGQVASAFGLVLPRKPLSGPKMASAIGKAMATPKGVRRGKSGKGARNQGYANSLTKGPNHVESFLSGGWEH